MSQHIANVDIRGDLRVRGRVGENLRVQHEVEALQFYLRGQGELKLGVDLSDGSETIENQQLITLNSNEFYLTKDSQGRALVNLTSAGLDIFDGVELFEDQTYLALNPSQFYLTKDSQGRPMINQPRLGPDFFDDTHLFRDQTFVSLNSAQFYLTGDSQSRVVINLGSVDDAVVDHGGLIGLTDDDHTQYLLVDGSRVAVKVKSGGFYVEPDTLGVGADLVQDFITFQIGTLAQKNYFIDGSAPFKYIIDKVVLRSESGFGNASFYINPDTGTGAGRYGRPIAGLTDFYIAPIRRTFVPNTPEVINEGDEWFMGVADSPTASDVVGTVTLRRSG